VDDTGAFFADERHESTNTVGVGVFGGVIRQSQPVIADTGVYDHGRKVVCGEESNHELVDVSGESRDLANHALFRPTRTAERIDEV
jgi:hypothetical protein